MPRKSKRSPEEEFTRTDTVVPSDILAREGRCAYIVILAGPHVGEMYKVKEDADILIGRAKGSEITLSDDGVSRRHALIRVEDGKFTIQDQGSHNGTYVGRERIKEHELADGDIIRVGGSTTMKFSIGDPLEEEYQRRLVEAALRDPLTGVYNRRYFQERLAAEYAAARRYGTALSLLLVDVDSFKQVNDTHGHSAGDMVLKAVATAMEEALRREDILVRYGGEEFAVLARGTDRAGASRVAERLRQKVAAHPTPWPGAKGGNITVTVSVGAATLDAQMSKRELVDRADRALYESKAGGKNRVTSAA